jgi:4-amino-4-deoxy-L-arabinose transferase-like glycosyltransferase
MPRGIGLLLLCGFTFVLGLSQPAITDSDEAFYAEAGREMLERGDWTTPHYNYEPRLQKPILFYWIIAATYEIAGISEWGARIGSALAGVGLALVAALVGRRWYGSNVGVLAGAVVATSFGVVPLARQSLPDTPLAFFVSLTIWAAIEALDLRKPSAIEPSRFSPGAWLAVAAGAAALGTLAKGPVAVALPIAVVLPLWIWQRRRTGKLWPDGIGLRQITLAVALFVVVAAPWYLAVMRAQGLEYAWRFFIGENVERFATAKNNTWRGYIYVPVIVGGLLPWSAFGALWIRPIAEFISGRRSLSWPAARLLCWAGGPLAFFMVSIGSQPRYILPSLVPLSILLARTAMSHATAPERSGAFRAGAVTAGLAITALGALLWRAVTVYASGGATLSLVGPVSMTAIGATLTVVACLAPRRVVPLLIAVAAGAALVVFNLTLLAPARPEPVEVIAAAIRTEGQGRDVCACGALGRSLPFYAGTRAVIADVNSQYTDELVYYLESDQPHLVVTDERVLAQVERQLGRTFPRLTSVTYLNTGIWQRGESLLAPDPRHVQRVVLVRNR